jgi:ferritin-like protein
MAHEGYHEPIEALTAKTRDLHRAIVSLQEELEAVDWYQQRVDVVTDPDLRRILEHNRDEEKEHAMMIVEWLRRHDVVFARNVDLFVKSRGEITTVEERAKAEPGRRDAAPAPAALSEEARQ